MAGHILDFYKRLQNETRMEVIDEQPLAVICVIPGTVRILSFENEIQIPFTGLPESILVIDPFAALVSRNARYAFALTTPTDCSGSGV